VPTGVYIAIAAITAANILIWLYLIAPGKCKNDKLLPFKNRVFADRGLYDLSKGIPENSLPAFSAAAEKGLGIALDVRLSHDSELFVLYGEDLVEACGAEEWADGLTMDKLKSFSLFGTQEKIPTLAEVLETVDGRVPLILNIGKSTRGHYLCAKINAMMKNYRGAWCIQSESPTLLSWFKKNSPQIPRGQMSASSKELNTRWNNVMAFIIRHSLMNYLTRPCIMSHTRSGKTLSFKTAQSMAAASFVLDIRSQQELDAALKDRRCFAVLCRGFEPQMR